jgi:DNA-binding transcriptional MerR regulator
MRIGELAARAGVNPKTIRFYEERRLLPQPARRASGYREYDEGDIARLTFVKAAQRLGLSLDEIGEVLAFKDRQVADIDGRLTELARLRSDLQALKARADCLPAKGGCYCRIIEHAQAKAR